MIKQHLTWTQIEDLAIRLADRLPTSYDVMLVITRGGMVPACIVSERLNLRNILVAAVMFYTGQERTLDKPIFLQFPADPLINGKRVLIVDDVWDSGRTIMAVRERSPRRRRLPRDRRAALQAQPHDVFRRAARLLRRRDRRLDRLPVGRRRSQLAQRSRRVAVRSLSVTPARAGWGGVTLP